MSETTVRRWWWATLEHPTRCPEVEGRRLFEVTENADGTRYVSAAGLGCSRDYRAASDKVVAATVSAFEATSQAV